MRFSPPATLVVALVAACLSPQAAAFVPSGDKLADAAGRANYESRRTGALRLEVALFSEPPEAGAEPIATGRLLSDPFAGAARLDLVGRNGVEEKHLARGGTWSAWRDGQRLSRPRPLLPPFTLLQVRFGKSLRAGLRGLGVDIGAAELARSGEHDCFVIGGVDAAATDGGFARSPAVWLDSYSYDIVRVDRSDGVRFTFGPSKPFGDRRIPGFVVLEEDGKDPLWLEVRGAAPAKTSAADFRPPQNP